MEYLGHIISALGVEAYPLKVEAMVNWLEPKDVKALRGFLGLTGHYRRLVKDYGKLAAQLTGLLKDSFWHQLYCIDFFYSGFSFCIAFRGYLILP